MHQGNCTWRMYKNNILDWKGSLNNVQTLDYPSTTHRANREMIKRYATYVQQNRDCQKNVRNNCQTIQHIK